MIIFLAALFMVPPGFAQSVRNPGGRPVRKDVRPVVPDTTLSPDSTVNLEVDIDVPVRPGQTAENDSVPPTVVTADDYKFDENGRIPFNPNPTRAVWLSALFPGLGQIYNRRYWKLPIVVGGFMGLGYATSWNAGQYNDYLQAYRDLMDADPGTKSYMNFFPPAVDESSLDRQWLERTFKYRKDFYRRNRDLCIICLVALYLVCIVDSYVDASMAHFDISPDLSLDLAPAVITNPLRPSTRNTAVGLQWALTF